MKLNHALIASVCIASLPAALVIAAPSKVSTPAAVPVIADSDWVKVDPDNILVIDTSRGRILAELYPSIAPKSVERIKTLARQHFYDGLTFFRVIDQFMAQTGDPQNTGTGGSTLPNVVGEFSFQRDSSFAFDALTRDGPTATGLTGAMPIGTQSDARMMVSATGTVSAWGMFCPGVLGMARAEDPNSANSQFFIMRQSNESLNAKYTAFGRVLVGLDAARLIKTGEPVPAPQDKMLRVRVGSDLPADEKVSLSRLNLSSAYAQRQLSDLRDHRGAEFTICDFEVKAK